MRKFLKPLLIGELAPEEPSQDGAQNVREQLEGLGTLPVASSSLFCITIGRCRVGLGLYPSPFGATVKGEFIAMFCRSKDSKSDLARNFYGSPVSSLSAPDAVETPSCLQFYNEDIFES